MTDEDGVISIWDSNLSKYIISRILTAGEKFEKVYRTVSYCEILEDFLREKDSKCIFIPEKKKKYIESEA